jgi:hypothetical protein
LLKFHLNNAFFSFNGKFYRQKKGLPIGSSIGGPLACLALALAEDRLLETLKGSDLTLAEIFQHYKRYLDDSLLIFGCKSREDANRIAQSILQLLNAMDPTFKFTTTGATQDLVVLDIKIQVVDNKLITKNYQKPTDKRTLLNSFSNHPEHVKKAIAYGVGLRMCRLCSEGEDFKEALIEQAWALLSRGHHPEWIKKGFA